MKIILYLDDDDYEWLKERKDKEFSFNQLNLFSQRQVNNLNQRTTRQGKWHKVIVKIK